MTKGKEYSSKKNQKDLDQLFSIQKESCLKSIDLSRKGGVDAPILQLIQDINSHEDYFTLSSCSGRSLILDNSPKVNNFQDNSRIKKGCEWIWTSHEITIDPEVLWNHLTEVSYPASLTFKMEPFILHVQCRNINAAQNLHHCSVDSGFRNSGLTVSKSGKIVVAVRSTHGLEVPLSLRSSLLVDKTYISNLSFVANEKLSENKRRTQNFHSKFVLIDNKLKTETIKPVEVARPVRSVPQNTFEPIFELEDSFRHLLEDV